jgi:ribosomal protein S18 acetylase RimI-like enzyme
LSHILDNPIYHSLISNHKQFAIGNSDAVFYRRAMASFAGFKDFSDDNFNWLYQNHPDDGVFILFSISEVEIPKPWSLIAKIEMCQLVYDSAEMLHIDYKHEIRNLDDKHIDEMKALVDLTKPGPFEIRTIDFGNYIGVFDHDHNLTSMNGQRFNPYPYREVSAVCTHPASLGRGYAYDLLVKQVNIILKQKEIPFLHVRADNVGAIKLYEKIGFKIRTRMKAYVIDKNKIK